MCVIGCADKTCFADSVTIMKWDIMLALHPITSVISYVYDTVCIYLPITTGSLG